ncbi:hypothetical protein HZB01_03795 [Candidatus Woesearchaeota archaeon]|nr:hypothetical protein [Candidatus Woesearchaeota archaeon]
MRGVKGLHIDAAAFTTGRATGARTHYVAGKFDLTRPIGILDLKTLVLTPSAAGDYLQRMRNTV